MAIKYKNMLNCLYRKYPTSTYCPVGFASIKALWYTGEFAEGMTFQYGQNTDAPLLLVGRCPLLGIWPYMTPYWDNFIKLQRSLMATWFYSTHITIHPTDVSYWPQQSVILSFSERSSCFLSIHYSMGHAYLNPARLDIYAAWLLSPVAQLLCKYCHTLYTLRKCQDIALAYCPVWAVQLMTT